MGHIEKLYEVVRNRCPREGENGTAVEFLRLYRSAGPEVCMPTFDTPYVLLVAGGGMRLHTPSGILDYVEGQYWVSAIDTPDSARVTERTPQGDFLAVAVALNASDALSVAIDVEGDLARKIADGEVPEEDSDRFDARLADAVARLVHALDDPLGLSFTAAHIRREIVFDALCGSAGQRFLQATMAIQQSGEIYELNSWIKGNYRERFSVDDLARAWGMSPSLLHARFKAAVGMGPLQCQKRLRLTEARRLLLDEGRNVTEACFEVGYESASQFARDYRKMFGSSPKEDVSCLADMAR